MRIVLASKSPQRKKLFEQLGLEFEILVSDIEENLDLNLSPEEVARTLAYQKAKNVADKVGKEALVIGSDTIVVIENEILGKPSCEDDIYDMLRKLSGNTHRVITGICAIDTSNDSSIVDNSISYVKMREISDDEIKSYIDSKEPFGKAGSYAVQGLGAIFIEKIEGSYSGIVGLPVFDLDRILKRYGIDVLGENI